MPSRTAPSPPAADSATTQPAAGSRYLPLAVASLGVAGLSVLSLFVGASDISPHRLLTDPESRELFLISRLPRTLALLLAGAAMSVAGLIMQMLTHNRFVEPATAGTVQSAALGILLMTILAPAAPLWVRMSAACTAALLGTALFLGILQRVALKSSMIVPLVGIMLGAVISAATTFIALRFDLLQTLGTWQSGDFSGVMQGRYEHLWLVGLLAAAAYVLADRLTAAGLGRDIAVNLGLNYRAVLALGVGIVAAISGVVVSVVGSLPFLGLIVPNLVSMTVGDHVRHGVPWVCLLGGGVLVLCDIVSRVVRAPFEIPVGSVLGVVGAAVFLFLLLRKGTHAGR
ncbi:iron chelate uptake ABC transporter family permease subunit [Lipingzhangella sp. LS1_29]|uniref:Iron chelate uptake ABC transporter family permease subunit n=1 Tax=Lipingzhangella rawalii TaxID=2055835 RepID=A0ABU2H6V8_9ACTN|nr:iron chelate uptake ABC transporter family permease subunit [Lipingzhangella rawalii]MDS1271042.1 iron chelate uptake ABC transporter family permease subunit [Lipingzhangella rawalii]